MRKLIAGLWLRAGELSDLISQVQSVTGRQLIPEDLAQRAPGRELGVLLGDCFMSRPSYWWACRYASCMPLTANWSARSLSGCPAWPLIQRHCT